MLSYVRNHFYWSFRAYFQEAHYRNASPSQNGAHVLSGGRCEASAHGRSMLFFAENVFGTEFETTITGREQTDVLMCLDRYLQQFVAAPGRNSVRPHNMACGPTEVCEFGARTNGRQRFRSSTPGYSSTHTLSLSPTRTRTRAQHACTCAGSCALSPACCELPPWLPSPLSLEHAACTLPPLRMR